MSETGIPTASGLGRVCAFEVFLIPSNWVRVALGGGAFAAIDIGVFVDGEYDDGTEITWVGGKVVNLVGDVPSCGEARSAWVVWVKDDHGGVLKGWVVLEVGTECALHCGPILHTVCRGVRSDKVSSVIKVLLKCDLTARIED